MRFWTQKVSYLQRFFSSKANEEDYKEAGKSKFTAVKRRWRGRWAIVLISHCVGKPLNYHAE